MSGRCLFAGGVCLRTCPGSVFVGQCLCPGVVYLRKVFVSGCVWAVFISGRVQAVFMSGQEFVSGHLRLVFASG